MQFMFIVCTLNISIDIKKSTKDIMQMLHLNETIDQLSKANSVRWYEHVLRKD